MPFDANGNYYDDGTDEGYASTLTPEQQMWAMQELLMSGGTMPQGMSGIAGLPQLDTKGREQPFDLGLAGQRLNYGQDIGSSMTNPFFQYAGGPGAYAPGALDPVYDEKRLDMLQGPQLQMMRESGGIRGLLADFILGNPAEGRPAMDSSQAAARVRAMIQNSTGDDPEIENLKGELLPITDQFGTAGDQPDFSIINKMADEIYKPYVAEQAMLQQPDVQVMPDGRVVQLTQRDSPTMEFLKKVGLPDPRAKYDVEFAMQNDPTLMTLMQTQAQTQSERDMIRKQYDDRVKRIQKRRDEAEGNSAEMEKYKAATQQALSSYFAQQAKAVEPVDVPRTESYEEGPPSWLGKVTGAVSEVPDYLGETLSRMAPHPADMGVPGKAAPGYGGIGDNLRGAPITTGPVLPNKPTGSTSMMDLMLGRSIRDQQPLADVRMRNVQRRRALEGEGTKAAWEYAMRLAPVINAGRRGQTPASDAIAQRMAGLRSMGAIGY